MTDEQRNPPRPPGGLPAYIGDILNAHAHDGDVLRLIAQHAHALRDWTPPTDPGEVSLDDVGPEGKVVDTRTKDGWTDVVKKVKCGKSECKCSDGSGLHGPYHYRVRTKDGKTEWEYVPKRESELL